MNTPQNKVPDDTAFSEQTRTYRPLGITLVAWFFILNSIRHAALALQLDSIPPGVKLEALFGDGLAVLVGVGLLGMRKWGVVLYFAMYAVNMFRILSMFDAESILLRLQSAAVLPLVVAPLAMLLFVLPYWRRMKWL